MYARTLLDCATANVDGKAKALLIGGGIANFTDVAATFKGIIQVQTARPSRYAPEYDCEPFAAFLVGSKRLFTTVDPYRFGRLLANDVVNWELSRDKDDVIQLVVGAIEQGITFGSEAFPIVKTQWCAGLRPYGCQYQELQIF